MTEPIREVFWLTSAEGQHLLYVSPDFETVWGYSCESLYNYPGGHLKLILDSIHPNDRDCVVAAWEDRRQAEYRAEYRIVRPDGAMRWVRSRSFPVQNSFGETWGIAGLSEDITEQKRAQEILHQRENELEKRVAERTAQLEQANTLLKQEIAERKQAQEALKAQSDFLQTVIDTNPNLIFVKDEQGKYLLANQACADFYGVTVEEMLGKTDSEWNYNQDNVELFVAQDRDMFASLQQTFIPESPTYTPTGELRWHQVIKKPLFSSNGQVGLVFGVCTDITERKLVEEALRESEQRYRLLVEGMNEGVVIVDGDGAIAYVNEKLAELSGYSPSELIGQPISPRLTQASEETSDDATSFMDDANLKIARDELARCKSGDSSSFELELRRKDGQRFLTIVSLSPIMGADGSFEGSLGVITDITPLKAVESELQQAKEQLRAVLDAVPGFVSWISSDGRYLGVNQHLANSFNLSPDDFVGKELGFLKNSPDFVRFMDEFLASSAQTDSQVIGAGVKGSTRNYLIAAQKYQQGTMAVSVGIDVTERKQAEETLKAQKEFLQTVLDTNPNLIYVKDAQSKLVLANQACADFYGIAVEELLGKSAAELHPYPAEVEQYIEQDREVLLAAREKFILEETYSTPNGEVRWYQTIKTPLFSSDGLACQVLGVSTDITERKQVEEQLRQSEEQLRLAMDAGRLGFWDWNLQTGKIVCSDSHERLFGCSPATYNGSREGFLAIVHPEDRDRLYRATQQAIETGEQCNLEFRVVSSDGTIRWIEGKSRAFYDEAGQPVRIAGVNTDISDRKLAEEQLRQSEAQLRLALDAARIGFWDWNLQTGTVIRSPSLEKMYGWTPDVADRNCEAFLASVHPEDRDLVRQSEQRSMETGEDCDVEFRIVLPDGSIRWMESKSQVFYDAKGKPLRMTGISLDISDRKQAEAKIKASLREKEVLLQEIHHRVKNNLQVVSSLLDLQSQHVGDRVIVEAFRESCNRVRSMALVHEKLYQSKDCAIINFFDYVESLTSYLFQAYARNAETIALELDIDEVTLNINTAIPCGLIITELVSNALKYAFPNSPGGKIDVVLHSKGNGNFTLVVRDDGIGFPENLDFKNVRSLGLKLVNVLTSQLEGKIELNRSAGTEFKISFSETT